MRSALGIYVTVAAMVAVLFARSASGLRTAEPKRKPTEAEQQRQVAEQHRIETFLEKHVAIKLDFVKICLLAVNKHRESNAALKMYKNRSDLDKRLKIFEEVSTNEEKMKQLKLKVLDKAAYPLGWFELETMFLQHAVRLHDTKKNVRAMLRDIESEIIFATGVTRVINLTVDELEQAHKLNQEDLLWFFGVWGSEDLKVFTKEVIERRQDYAAWQRRGVMHFQQRGPPDFSLPVRRRLLQDELKEALEAEQNNYFNALKLDEVSKAGLEAKRNIKFNL
eukprot:Filipodium_phascolosomae@DN579_c0_g1_i1.p1